MLHLRIHKSLKGTHCPILLVLDVMMISRVARKQKTRQYKELMHFIYPGQGPGAVSPFRVVPHPLEHQLGKDSLMSMTLVIVCGTESINAQIQMSKAFYN